MAWDCSDAAEVGKILKKHTHNIELNDLRKITGYIGSRKCEVLCSKNSVRDVIENLADFGICNIPRSCTNDGKDLLP